VLPVRFERTTCGLGIRSRGCVCPSPMVFGLLSCGSRPVESSPESPNRVLWMDNWMDNSALTSGVRRLLSSPAPMPDGPQSVSVRHLTATLLERDAGSGSMGLIAIACRRRSACRRGGCTSWLSWSSSVTASARGQRCRRAG